MDYKEHMYSYCVKGETIRDFDQDISTQVKVFFAGIALTIGSKCSRLFIGEPSISIYPVDQYLSRGMPKPDVGTCVFVAGARELNTGCLLITYRTWN